MFYKFKHTDTMYAPDKGERKKNKNNIQINVLFRKNLKEALN